MATAPRFDEGLYAPQQSPQKRSGWQNCLIGCLIVCAIIAVLLILIGIWVSRNWRGWIATGASEVVSQGIDASDLPPQEKIEIKVQVDRVATAFRDGQMSNEQLAMLFEKLAQSPLLTSLAVSFAETKYFAKSGLSEEEKVAGRQTLQRFVRGTIDEKIPQDAVDAVVAHIGTTGPDGEFELKETVTDDELRAFLAAAKAEADKAGIADQPEEVDPSDEFKRIIDEALAVPPAEPATN